MQLVRVETCGCAEGFAREGNVLLIWYKYNYFKYLLLIFNERLLIAIMINFFNFYEMCVNYWISHHIADTEIQNIQIVEGDINNDLKIPIYMIFPRLFSCPSLITTNFKIGKYYYSFLYFISTSKVIIYKL